MPSALPTSHIYDQLVSPFYDTADLTQWWGVCRQAIANTNDAATGTVIACQLDGGGWDCASGSARPVVDSARIRGTHTSSAVQIDHIVALSNS